MTGQNERQTTKKRTKQKNKTIRKNKNNKTKQPNPPKKERIKSYMPHYNHYSCLTSIEIYADDHH